MDKKKKVIAAVMVLCACVLPSIAVGQEVARVQLMDKHYSNEAGKDSVTVFFNILDDHGERQRNLTLGEILTNFTLKEDGRVIPAEHGRLARVDSGLRIPSDYTFSVLVDLGISENGKNRIADLVKMLVESAPDSCVYLSFFGNEVGPTQMITKDTYSRVLPQFKESAKEKVLYGALYAKLSEFEVEAPPLYEYVIKQSGYEKNDYVALRSAMSPDRSVLFVFTEGHRRPTVEEHLAFLEVSDYQIEKGAVLPTVYAFYYTEDGNDPDIKRLLQGICSPAGLPERKGAYLPADNIEQVMLDFEQVVSERSYDYAYTYRAFEDKEYVGKTSYQSLWRGIPMGEGGFSIGSPERPWPNREEGVGGSVVKYLVALLLAILVFAVFFAIMKVVIPLVRSKMFEKRYYRSYVQEENVRRRVCCYCGQEIEPGQDVVVKCRHMMHVGCWRQNGYCCAEYGQNCNEGIQPHVHWKELFSKNSLRDSLQTLSGVVAALVAWLAFEIGGRGGFNALAEWIVRFSMNDAVQEGLFFDCVEKASSFLLIGMTLGFFLSLVFRYNDEYRSKDWKVLLKIVGLSMLTGLAGMAAYAVGAVLLCVIVSIVDTTYIPWYASLPAYILFALSVAGMMSWKTSAPLKSALLGGGVASVIGFVVLFFTTASNGWMNMLLNFIIFGGGIGASLVTVRMLSERYFLVVQNGVRAGLRIPIHKWMNATGGGNKVSIGMTGECEIQMNWEKSNKVAKEHARLYIDHDRNLPILKPLATGVVLNNRAELSVGKPYVLANGDTFKIGDTIFKYDESDKV